MLQKAEMGGDFQHTQPIRAGLGAREKQREVNNFILGNNETAFKFSWFQFTNIAYSYVLTKL